MAVSEEHFNKLVDQLLRLVDVIKQQATQIHDLTVKLDKVEKKADYARDAAYWPR